MRLWELLSPTVSRVDELMNQPAAFSWKRQSDRSWEATFKIGSLDYWVYLDGADGNSVDLVFTDGEGREEITGSGNSFQVFATVAAVVRDFLQHRKPDSITFTAKGDSRVKLYQKLAANMAQEIGGRVRTFTDSGSAGFEIYIDRDDAYESLHEDGKIIPNVNTTVDVQPGETQRQAEKFGNKLDAKSRPPLLRGSYGDDSARFSANQGDPFYGSDGTRLTGERK